MVDTLTLRKSGAHTNTQSHIPERKSMQLTDPPVNFPGDEEIVPRSKGQPSCWSQMKIKLFMQEGMVPSVLLASKPNNVKL